VSTTTTTPPPDTPRVRHGTLDGAPVTFVLLKGPHAEGREMILDAVVWRLMVARGGAQCSVKRAANGRLFVVHPRLGPMAGWIVDAPKGEHVRFKNGPFDLRRSSLNLSREEALIRKRQLCDERAEAAAKWKAMREAERKMAAAHQRETQRAAQPGRLIEVMAATDNGDGTANVTTRERRVTVAELERATAKLMARLKRRGATETPKAA
jgi:hypothetical protein